jgi:hypothetical protein
MKEVIKAHKTKESHGRFTNRREHSNGTGNPNKENEKLNKRE